MARNQVDVLIVGAGPAGLFLATQLSKLKVNTRIVDKMAHPVLRGHADGLQCRTGEVFEALDVQHKFARETHECAEVIIWEHDEDVGGIKETSRVVDTLPGLSWVRHVNLGQDRVEAIFMEAMEENDGLKVERLTTPTSMAVDETKLGDPDAYPITVTLKHLQPTEWENGDVKSGLYRSNLFADEGTQEVDGDEEVVQCKYLIGCDGARSWVRKTLGVELHGDSNNVYWGAFDAVIDTDLPTSRMKHMAHSKSDGTVLMVPREEGMVRVYTQLGTLAAGERVNRAEITLDKLLSKTASVLKPYNIKFPYVDWWTCYEIGQRVCDTFSAYDDHVFIAGDACHTHSPKAGQGMNVSMMDTFNLGWKLACVLRRQARRKILHTYQLERQKTAQELIDFDYKWSRLFTGQNTPGKADEMGELWTQSIKFTSGTGVVYHPGLLVLEQDNELAKKIIVGSHFENRQVVGVFNAHAIQLQTKIKADARWRIILFPGDIRLPDRLASLRSFAENLNDPSSPVRKYTPTGSPTDSVIETLTVFATPHRDVQLLQPSLPEVLVPIRPPYGVRAFDTLFSDEESYHDGHGRAYDGYGIDPAVGCVVVVRPDQHVSGVFAMDNGGFSGIAAFFDRFMLAPK